MVFFLLGNYFPTQVFNLGCPELLKFETDLYKYAPVKYRIWFQNNMELEDIEYFFNPSIRLYTESVFSNGTFILTFCHVIFCALIFKEIRDKISRYVFFISMIYGKQLI